MPQKALLIVDVQNDFCPDVALAVPRGDEVVPVLNQYIEHFQKTGAPIFASRDWHPSKTAHFHDYGGLWPVHCVQNTPGAQFHPQLKLPKTAVILSKGMDVNKDSYSAFQGIDDSGKDFHALLTKNDIREIFVGGLATDYCLRASVSDALKFGFEVNLLADAIKGVDVNQGDSRKAVEEMIESGVKTMTIKDLKK